MTLIRKHQEVYVNSIEKNPALGNNKAIIDFPVDNNSCISLKLKEQITGQTLNNDEKNIEIMIPLNHISHFWRTLEIPLINCEISPMLICSSILIASTIENQVPTFTIIDTNIYVLVVTLSTKDNVKRLKQLESCFKKTINWNKYQSKVAQ